MKLFKLNFLIGISLGALGKILALILNSAIYFHSLMVHQSCSKDVLANFSASC